MSVASPPFDLRGLYRAIDAERELRGMSWSGVAREVGVAASTIRRFESADDAEADGVLALVRWLGCPPENFVTHSSVDGRPLDPVGHGYVRVDMDLISRANGDHRRSARSSTRTTIQRLVDVAQRSGEPIAALTRLSEV